MSEPAQSAGAARSGYQRLALVLVLLYTLGCAAGNFWEHRFSCEAADCVSYLDLGRAFAEGRWGDFVNSYWSPAFPVLLGIAFNIYTPDLATTYPLLNAVHFGTFLLAWLAALFFLHQLIVFRRDYQQPGTLAAVQLSDLSLLMVGMLLFTQAALVKCPTFLQGPNLLFLAAILTASGQLLRIKRGCNSYGNYALLGLIVALGYYFKAPMLPIGVLMILAAGVGWKPRQVRFTKVLVAGMVLAGCMLPWVVALHGKYGYWTTGDSARINYAIYVSKTTRHCHGHRRWPDPSLAVHPARTLPTTPPLQEFNHSDAATYTIWFDPPYWQAGMQPIFRFGLQCRATYAEVIRLSCLVLRSPDLIVLLCFATIFVYACYTGARAEALAGLRPLWFLFLTTFSGLAMFLMVLALPRHVAGILLIGSISLLAGMQLPWSRPNLKLMRACEVLLLCSCLAYLWQPTENLAMLAANLTVRTPNEGSYLQQQALTATAMGMKPGDYVCSIEYPVWHQNAVLRLCQVRVVAEVLNEDRRAFWQLSAREQEKLFEELRSRNVSFVSAIQPPFLDTVPKGWKLLGSGPPMILRDIRPPSAAPSE